MNKAIDAYRYFYLSHVLMAVVTDITTQHTHANTQCSNTNTITGYITLYADLLSLFNTCKKERELRPDQCYGVIVANVKDTVYDTV